MQFCLPHGFLCVCGLTLTLQTVGGEGFVFMLGAYRLGRGTHDAFKRKENRRALFMRIFQTQRFSKGRWSSSPTQFPLLNCGPS